MGSYMGHEYNDSAATYAEARGGNGSKPVEGRYRVGDRVRVVKGEEDNPKWSYHTESIGSIFTLKEWTGSYWCTNGSYFYEHEIAPAFRPGDRVRLNKHYGTRACGERGTVSAVLGDSVSVRMDERSYWGGRVAVFFDSALDWERDEGEQHATSARVPWQDDEPKPKFKAGDSVMFLGNQCEVDMIRVENDGSYRYRVDGHCWTQDCFLTAAPCPQDNVAKWSVNISADSFVTGLSVSPSRAQPCIVALVKNGQPRPSTYPHVHASVAAAAKEAERLARINPGQEFAVYQRVTARVAEVQMKEVA